MFGFEEGKTLRYIQTVTAIFTANSSPGPFKFQVVEFAAPRAKALYRTLTFLAHCRFPLND